jgi:hypothetical protein
MKRYLFNGYPVTDRVYDTDTQKVTFTANGIEYETDIYHWVNGRSTGLIKLIE